MTKNIVVNGKIFDMTSPLIMSIINVTPDSFFEKSRCQDTDSLTLHIKQALSDGADIIDLGACSTRHDSEPVSAEEELSRISFALDIIKKNFDGITLSIDTFRAEIARFATQNYPNIIINDISAGSLDVKLFRTIAEIQCPYVLSHYPEDTLPDSTPDDVFLSSVLQFFAKKIENLRSLGFNGDIILDPGFGFGKTTRQNLLLLRNLHHLDCFGLPILAGISRKSMIYKTLGCTPDSALNGTTAMNTLAITQGANILRVHDTREAAEIRTLLQAMPAEVKNPQHIIYNRKHITDNKL